MAEAILRYLTYRDRRLIDRSPIFFGWLVVAAATLGMAATIPAQTAGLSLFIDALIADLGISRSAISLAYTFATVAGALALPRTGRWIDQYGPRRAVVVIVMLFGVAVMSMGLVAGLVTLTIGFVLVRGLGQGALSLVSLHVVNLWFIRQRGRAVGIVGMGLALAMAFFPIMVEHMIASVGWRQAFVLIGSGLLVVMLPIGLLLFRPKPESFGLLPDGARADDKEHVPANETVMTLAEARGTFAFWILTLGSTSVAALGTGLMFHHFSILGSNGLDRTAAALMFVPLGMVTAGMTLSTGLLLDRFQPRKVLSTMLFVFAALLVSVPLVRFPGAVWSYGVVFGLVQGMVGALTGSAYAHYFGREHIGAIKGFSKTILVGGSAIGPLVYGLGFEFFGSYTIPLVASAFIPLGLGIAAAVKPDRVV